MVSALLFPSTRRVRGISAVICLLGAATLALPAIAGADAVSVAPGRARTPVVRWTAAAPYAVRDAKAAVLGAPARADEALQFDGTRDALVFPTNPLQGLAQFTVQILIRPDPDGAPEQRFFHAQDQAGHRVLMELRLDHEARSWSLDTYLHASADDKLTLLDREKKHAAGKWTWVSLTYDGKTMRHYVDRVKDAEGAVDFAPMTSGETSLGVRLTRVNWFKGAIREVRIFDVALPPEEISAP